MALIKTYKELELGTNEYFEELEKANNLLKSSVINFFKLDKFNDENIINKVIYNGVVGIDQNENKLIGKKEEELTELINQIRHIEIVAVVGKYLLENKGILTECHPAQSSSTNKNDSYDLVFEKCIVEVYGGKNITNNSKLNKDIKSLLKNKKDRDIYIAFYKTALSENSKFYKALVAKVTVDKAIADGAIDELKKFKYKNNMSFILEKNEFYKDDRLIFLVRLFKNK